MTLSYNLGGMAHECECVCVQAPDDQNICEPQISFNQFKQTYKIPLFCHNTTLNTFIVSSPLTNTSIRLYTHPHLITGTPSADHFVVEFNVLGYVLQQGCENRGTIPNENYQGIVFLFVTLNVCDLSIYRLARYIMTYIASHRTYVVILNYIISS